MENCKSHKNILLTGATGFLGIYLLREILLKSNTNVFVLVRGENDEHSKARLIEKFEYYFDIDLFEQYQHRITVLNSDLTKQDLGLLYYNNLLDNIDCIIHSAALVKHYGLYKDFYDANVVATENLLEFASANCIDFHYISTLSVSLGNITDDNGNIVLNTVFTEDDTDVGQSCDNNYINTKLIAEIKVIEARKKKINSNIYRVGNIVFDSKTGVFQQNIEDNGFYQRVESFLNLGVIMDEYDETDFSYVDQLSEAIICLISRKNLINEIFHLKNDTTVKLSNIFTEENLCSGIKKLNITEFINFIKQNYDNDIYKNYIEKIVLHNGWFEDLFHEDTTFSFVLCNRTEAILEKIGFCWDNESIMNIKHMISRTLDKESPELYFQQLSMQ